MLPRHVYLHVPFCARRCSYCDFAIAVRRNVPVNEYIESIRRELRLRFPGNQPWSVETLYLGGGTPSRLGGSGIARLLDAVRERVTILPTAEITLEANPEDVTPDSADAWRRAGINRISIGAQSFDDAVLRWMHRTHNAAAIPRAVFSAREAGLRDLSLDLIFALPPELSRSWERDLDEALALDPDHLSLYGLTIEPLTPLGRWRDRGATGPIPDEQYEQDYLLAHEATSAAGFEHYEVSNFARQGHRARHNSAYWRGVAYAGLGPGAHEFNGDLRRWNVGVYVAWVRRLAAGEDPLEGSEVLDAENHETEAVYLGLRTDGGVRLSEAELAEVAPWCSAGWGTVHDDKLVLTPLGWLRLDSLAADLTLVRSR